VVLAVKVGALVGALKVPRREERRAATVVVPLARRLEAAHLWGSRGGAVESWSR
jgi:hypothetical protein